MPGSGASGAVASLPTVELTEISTAAGPVEGYLALPEGAGPFPGVLFCMDVRGVRPRLAEMADRIASWGYVVWVPNLFHREGTVEQLLPERDLAEPGAREEYMARALPRIGRLTTNQVLADLPAYLELLRSRPEVGDGPLGVTGYCMGARVALRAATIDPGVGAVGLWHGAHLVTDNADSPHLGLERSRARFVAGHAHDDGTNPPEAITTLGAAFEAAGVDAVNEVYPAAHGYTMTDGPAYDEAATERHFRSLRELFDATLRP